MRWNPKPPARPGGGRLADPGHRWDGLLVCHVGWRCPPARNARRPSDVLPLAEAGSVWPGGGAPDGGARRGGLGPSLPWRGCGGACRLRPAHPGRAALADVTAHGAEDVRASALEAGLRGVIAIAASALYARHAVADGDTGPRGPSTIPSRGRTLGNDACGPGCPLSARRHREHRCRRARRTRRCVRWRWCASGSMC